MRYIHRLRKVEAALQSGGKCTCRDIKAVVWNERTDTQEQFDAALERARQRPYCPVHRKPPTIPIVRITRWWPGPSPHARSG